MIKTSGKIASVALILALNLAVTAAHCRGGSPTARPASSPAEVPEQCGECLDYPTGQVCTARGTLRNSCLAICTRELILCKQACPCPAE